jgi:hypothetical protein
MTTLSERIYFLRVVNVLLLRMGFILSRLLLGAFSRNVLRCSCQGVVCRCVVLVILITIEDAYSALEQGIVNRHGNALANTIKNQSAAVICQAKNENKIFFWLRIDF